MDKAEMAQANFLKGYNCAQSVLLAFAPECGLSEETAAKLASSFGGGVARLREVCGAVSGMAMAAGLIKGYADPADRQAKIDHYALVQAMAAEFRAELGTILCRELLKDIATTAGAGEPEPRTRNITKSAAAAACASPVRPPSRKSTCSLPTGKTHKNYSFARSAAERFRRALSMSSKLQDCLELPLLCHNNIFGISHKQNMIKFNHLPFPNIL